MRKLIFSLLILQLFTVASAQKTEISLSLNSGLFSFSGSSAVKESSIIYSSANVSNSYTNNPYGSRAGLCYGLSVNMKRISKSNFIFATGLGYEILRSKVSIALVSDNSGTGLTTYAATGKTFLNFQFINLTTQIGYRLNSGSVYFDFLGGVDIARCLSAREKGEAFANSKTYVTDRNRTTIKTDFRPGLQINAGYKKTGVYIGFSRGLTNYLSGMTGGINEAYCNLFRFGLTQQLN